MRKSLLAGVLLALAAMIVVIISQTFDLNLESAALLGAAVGAVIALVPDQSPGSRLGGFAAGFVVSWVGYVLRAQFLPDTAGGRAVTVAVVILLCVLIAAATKERLRLWSLLLGAGAFAGAYEYTYNQAPPQVLSTSLSTATTLAFDVAIGFLVAAFFAPASGEEGHESPEPSTPSTTDPDAEASLDDLMKEPAK